MADEPLGYVYFVEAEGAGRIKIGWTDGNPTRRFNSLQTGSCLPLLPLGVLIGPASLERQMHSRFAEWREIGEWFRAVPELREFIEEAVHPWPKAKERIVRPGRYEFRESSVCHKAFCCDQCRRKVNVGDEWLLYESSKGDRAHVCRPCVHVPDARRKKNFSIHSYLVIEKLIHVPVPAP